LKKRYFVLAAIFLFNPLVSVIDVLPDFIAYLLLMKGLSHSSYAYDSASDAHDAMQKMFYVSFFRVVCALLLPLTDATMALVFSFSFFILECIFGIDAYIKLFNYLSYIEMRCGDERIVPKSEKLKKFTVAFLVIKVVFAFIPDTLALFLTDDTRDFVYNLRMPLYVAFVAIVLVVGIVWLVAAIRFFNIALTKEICEKIEDDFKETTRGRESIFFSKDFMFAITVFGYGTLLLFDLFSRESNYLPDFAFTIVALFAFFFLVKRKHILMGKIEKLFLAISALHIVASVSNTVFSAIFFDKYILGNIGYRKGASEYYLGVSISGAVESVLLFFMLFVFIRMFKEHAVKRITENPRFFSEYSVEGFLEDFSRIYKKKSIITTVFLGISCLLSLVFGFVRPYNEGFVVYIIIFDVALIFYLVRLLLFVYDNVYKMIRKYS